MDIENSIQPTHSVDFKSHIYVVEFSPFEWSHNLICVAMDTKIAVGVVKFQEENMDQEEEVEFHLVREFHNARRICAVAWSPETSLSALPKVVVFAAAGADHVIRVICSDLADTDTVAPLTGHTAHVNALAYDPNGSVLASGGDDHTVRLWEDNAYVATIVLDSPVVSICWHQEEPCKLLVAEQDGIIRLFNSQTQRALLSMSTDEFPLSQMHWAPSRANVVAAVASKYLVLWDITKPSHNENVRAIYGDGAVCVRVCPTNHQLVALIGEPRHELKVIHAQSRATLLATPCKIYGGMTWHSKLPYICVSIDRKLCMWKVGSK